MYVGYYKKKKEEQSVCMVNETGFAKRDKQGST